MKLKTTLLSYGVISITCAMTIGSIGYWAISKVDNSMDAIVISSEALRGSMQADMMHDALRADVFALIVAAEDADNTAIKAAQADIGIHSESFLKSLDVVAKQSASAQAQAALESTRPKVEGYILAAKEMSGIAANQVTATPVEEIQADKNVKSAPMQSNSNSRMETLHKQLPQFLATFAELETEMASLGDHIESFNKTTQAQGDSAVLSGKNLVTVLGLLTAIALIFIAVFITRRIMNTVGGEPTEVLDAANEIAHGNLANSIVLNTGDNSSLLAAIKIMQTNLHRLVAEIKTSADSISTGAQEISAGNTNLSQRTEEQASSLEETASSMEQMASTVKQNAENAKQANVLASNASDVAIKGGAVVGQVVTTMADINTSSKKIVDIISVIDGIAFQTNILALNAAVEAARAGEQGRGFAVVATEVRNLAQRSASAAKEIKQLIGDSVEKVAGGTVLVGDAGKTMDEIVASVKKVTDIVNEIAAASQEQSAGIDQVNNAITNMDEVTQQNAALVEEAAAAASSLESKAQELADITSKFILSAVKLTLGESTKVDLNLVSPSRVDELTSKKMNGYSRLKAPKTKENDNSDWTAF